MSKPITITTTMTAWLTSYGQRDFLGNLEKGELQKAAESLHFSNQAMDKGSDPWARIGEAQIKVAIESRDAVVAAAVATLKAELDHARAEWLTKQQGIMSRISELQALESNGGDAR